MRSVVAKGNEPKTKRRRVATSTAAVIASPIKRRVTRSVAAVTPTPRPYGARKNKAAGKNNKLKRKNPSTEKPSSKSTTTRTPTGSPLELSDKTKDAPTFLTPEPAKEKTTHGDSTTEGVDKSSESSTVTPELSKEVIGTAITDTSPTHTPTSSPTTADTRKRKRDEAEQQESKAGLYGRGATICIAASVFAVAVASTSSLSAGMPPVSSPIPKTPTKHTRYGSYRPLRQRRAVRPKLSVRPPSLAPPSNADEKIRKQPFRNLMDVIKKVKSTSDHSNEEEKESATLPIEAKVTSSLRATVNAQQEPLKTIGDGSSNTQGKSNPIQAVQKASKKLGDGLVNVARCVAGKCINDLRKHIKEQAEERKATQSIEQ